MSLQGTLDTFALPDVLRLLAATRKSGRLRLDLDLGRGPAGLWMANGAVVAIATPGQGGAGLDEASAASAEALSDVLRSPEGTFVFEPGATSPVMADSDAAEPVEVESLLAEAEELLVEWRALMEVVPSLACSLALRPELDGAHATVSADHWRLVVAVGSGTTVGQLGTDLGEGELAASRSVKGLVEAGLAVVGPVPEPDPRADLPTDDVPADDVPADEPTVDMATDDEVPDLPTGDEPAGELVPGHPPVDGFIRRPPGAGTARQSSLGASLGELAALADDGRGAGDGSDEQQAAVARQLVDLGPDAVAAVTAAAEATTPEERDAALDAIEVHAGDEPVNRGALLKFLSSVRP